MEQRAQDADESEEDEWEAEGVSFVPVKLGTAAPTLPDFLKVRSRVEYRKECVFIAREKDTGRGKGMLRILAPEQSHTA